MSDTFNFSNLINETLDSFSSKPPLLRWYDDTTVENVEAYVNPAHATFVTLRHKDDDGGRRLQIRLTTGRYLSTEEADTIDRFLDQWSIV